MTLIRNIFHFDKSHQICFFLEHKNKTFTLIIKQGTTVFKSNEIIIIFLINPVELIIDLTDNYFVLQICSHIEALCGLSLSLTFLSSINVAGIFELSAVPRGKQTPVFHRETGNVFITPTAQQKTVK